MKKKLLVPVLCILMMLIGGFATWAYLTSQDEVVNTFTVGDVEITLDEAKVNPDGTYVTDANNRVDRNNYHLVPGHPYVKDPTVHIQADSEPCYVFVSVKNEIAAIESSVKEDKVAAQMAANGWTVLTNDSGKTVTADGGVVYYYNGPKAESAVVPKNVTAVTDLLVFSTFKIDGETVVNLQEGQTAGELHIDGYAGKTIVVKAYAAQADGFATPFAAWDAAF